ncbi:MAG: radical SAM protein, partial [Kiritimatiellae bacterium]|nr:radical SAM protein [Kiritimatiellia bacterium]
MKIIYTDTKIFHFPAKLHDLRVGRVSAPIHVRLKPTNRCNHRCVYCCFRNPQLPPYERMNEADEIPGEKLVQIADDLVTMGVRAVTLSGGGEPLCHPA